MTDDGAAKPDNPIEDAVADDAREAARGRYGWLSLVVAGLFGQFYAYDLWEAVSNFVELPAAYDAIGLDSADIPWWVLWIGLLIPPAIYALAFGVGRRQNVGGKAVIFLVGLAVVAGLSLGVIALEAVLRPELVLIPNEG
jgi:hypothetical protein